MTYFWSHWKQYNKIIGVIIVVTFIIGGVAGELIISQLSFFNFDGSVIPQNNYQVFNGPINLFLAWYWLSLFLAFVFIDCIKVFVIPIRRNYIIEEITQQYSRKQIYFTKTAYLITSVSWKWLLLFLSGILGMIIITEGNSELIGSNFLFLITGFIALLFVSIGAVVVFSTVALYTSTRVFTLASGSLLAANTIYIFIVILDTVLFPGVRGMAPDGSTIPVPTYNTQITNLDLYNDFFAATCWLNINYQFILVVSLFQGNAFQNISQIFVNSGGTQSFGILVAIFAPRRYSQGMMLSGNNFAVIDQGNFLNPYVVIFGWATIISAMYGLNFHLFAKRDFN